MNKPGKLCGIYKIQSKIKPDRIYIGSAIDIHKRWRHHKEDLRKNKHCSAKLQRHYNKYGELDLNFSVILTCEKNREIILSHEQFFIDIYKPWFNVCDKAGSPLGVRRSEETRRKISEVQKGKKRGPLSEETKQKIREARVGFRYSIESREKMKRSQTGMKRSEAHRECISKSLKGRIFTEEHRKKLSKAQSGKKMTAVQLEKAKSAWELRKLRYGKTGMSKRKDTVFVIMETPEKK